MRLKGVPTAISVREAAALQRYASNRLVVEAGALLGGSTILMAEVASQVVSIDRHEGYTAPTYRQFMSNLDRHGVAVKVKPVIGDATTQLSLVSAEFAFIDLTGTYEATRAALDAVQAEIVAVHDVCRSRCNGVERAIKDAGLTIVEQVDTLVICGRKR